MNFSGISAATLKGKLLRIPLRLLPSGTVVPVLQGRLLGKKWVVGSGNHGCWLGTYEFEKQRLFVNTVRPGSVVFDIGAHVGFYTLLASQLVGETGKVCSFEPSRKNLYYLKRHLRLNHCWNVSVFPVAVGANCGRGFFEESSYRYQGHLTSTQKGLMVSVVALDELLSLGEVPIPDYVKIDVEGTELEVLLGARSVLQLNRPTIFLATHDRAIHEQCCGYLTGLDYELYPVTGDNLSETAEILALPLRGRNKK